MHVACECAQCFTLAGPLLQQHICQGGLASSKEVGEADGFHLDSTVAGVGHAADQLGDAAGVMLQDCIQCLCVLPCAPSKHITAGCMAETYTVTLSLTQTTNNLESCVAGAKVAARCMAGFPFPLQSVTSQK